MKNLLLLPLCLVLSLYSCGQTAINNTPLTVSSLAVSPSVASTIVGGSVTFTCLATLSNGTTKSITNQANWQSSAPAVAYMGTTNIAGYNVATGKTVGTTSITCSDDAGDTSAAVTLTVLSSPAITNPNASTCANPCPLPAGTQSSLYTPFNFAATGGILPYVWSNSVGSPPTGMSLSSAGALTGTPSGIGTTNWTVQVCDALTNCATLPVTITVSAAAGCGTPSNYCANTSVSIVAWPNSVPSVGTLTKNGSTVTDSSLPPNSGSSPPIVRCTDFAVVSGATTALHNEQSKSAGLGGSADAEWLFSVDSTMLHGNTTGGLGFIILFNPSTMVCGDASGFAITTDKNLTTGGGSTATLYNFGAGSFDWTDTGAPTGYSYYYGMGGTDSAGNTMAKFTIKKADGTFTFQSPFIDFSYGLPVSTTLAPSRLPSHTYSFGDYFSYTFPGLPDWNGSTAWIMGDLIKPLTNNPAGCAFKLTTVGTRGTQPGTWSTGSTCTVAANLTEGGGTEQWRNIGNGGTFLFQVTSASGQSGSSSTPTLATTPTGGQTIHPDEVTTFTDGALTVQNVGVMIPVPVWRSFGGISKNSTRSCYATSFDTYGNGGTKYGSNDSGGQGSGSHLICYSSALNEFVLLNTITGIQSVVTCSGGTGYNCSGGTQSKLTAQSPALSLITTGCSFQIHNLKGGSTLDYVVIAQQGTLSGTCLGPGTSNLLDVWQPFATYNSATTLQYYNTLSNHWTIGKSKLVNLGDGPANFGYTSGAYSIVLDSSNPTATATTSWQVGAPYTNPCDVSWVANDLNPPCDFGKAYDSHLAFWHDSLDDDLGPVCGTIYNVTTLAPPPVAPWQGEEVCVTTTPTWNPSVGPIGAWNVYRFAHNFNTGGNSFFDTQFAISQLSQDGKFLAFSSDWNCTLGNTAGNANPLTTYCGPPWNPSYTYTLNAYVNPFASTSGSGANYGVYQVTNCGTQNCKSASTKPSWFTCNSTSAGSTVTDANGVVYTCKGTGNGKGEIFVVKLQ